MFKKTQRPLEALLRAPVEWWSATACLVATFVLLLENQFVCLLPPMNLLVAGLMSCLGIKRFFEGFKVVYYQYHLRSLPRYILASKQMPIRQKQLFLGKGFCWQPKHTQRLWDCQQQPRYGKRSFGKAVENSGNTTLQGVEMHEQSVWMNLSDRVGHTLVLGTTRVGKTRLLELLVSQDIRRGDAVIVFDPKGDSDLLRRMVFEAKSCGREKDVLMFHLGFPSVSARYNPIGHFARITEVANRVANQLPSSGESAAFKEFGWRFVNIIAKTLVALQIRPDYKQIHRYLLHMDDLLLAYCQFWLPTVDVSWEAKVKQLEKGFNTDHVPLHLRNRSKYLLALVHYLKKNHLSNAIVESLCSAFHYDKTYFDKITASLLPLMEKLTTGPCADLISPDYFDSTDERSIFDWMQVIREKKIVYVGLDALSDATVASAVGNSMFADLCSVAGQLYKYGVEGLLNENPHAKKVLHPVCIHSDEFSELIGDEFIPLLNKAGGSGFQVTVYTQTWSDVEAKLGQKAKAGQVAGNLNTLICLRVLEEETARLVTQKLPQNITVKNLIPVSSVTDNRNNDQKIHFSTNNEDRLQTREVPLLSPADLMQLPKGQAFCLLQGGEVWKIRIPLPEDDLSEIPDSVEAMVKWMQL
jgi:conjugative coupling factor TraD (TOL family)